MEIESYREVIDKALMESRPLSAQWELTYKCNHLCTFCFNAMTKEKELTTAEIKSGLEKINDLGVFFITLTGGEAMVRPDFFEICEYVRQLGFALRVFSNGYLINEENARRLKELGVFDMEISIHGARAETHDRLTGIRGSFERLMTGLGCLRGQGVKVNLKCPITHLNQEEVREVWKVAGSFGCSLTFDPVMVPRTNGDKSPLALSASQDFLVRFFGEEFKDLRHGKDVEKFDDSMRQTNCGTGRIAFTIDPYGNIFPCVMWRRKWGNIKEVVNLSDLWRNSEVLKQVRWAAEQIPLTTLKQSEAGDFCTFCPGAAESQTGSPFKMYPQAEAVGRARMASYEAALERRVLAAGSGDGPLGVTECS